MQLRCVGLSLILDIARTIDLRIRCPPYRGTDAATPNRRSNPGFELAAGSPPVPPQRSATRANNSSIPNGFIHVVGPASSAATLRVAYAPSADDGRSTSPDFAARLETAHPRHVYMTNSSVYLGRTHSSSPFASISRTRGSKACTKTRRSAGYHQQEERFVHRAFLSRHRCVNRNTELSSSRYRNVPPRPTHALARQPHPVPTDIAGLFRDRMSKSFLLEAAIQAAVRHAVHKSPFAPPKS